MSTDPAIIPHLCLFLTRGVPLAHWAKQGTLWRETAVYRHLQPRIQLSLLTSGDASEQQYQSHLPNATILPNRWPLSTNLYSLLAPLLHWRALRQATLYKTNQLDGAWTAVLAAKLHHKPVIVRAGYLWAENFAREKGMSAKIRLIFRLQRAVLRSATHLVVTTPAMKTHFVSEYQIFPEKITIIPNYVDTTRFAPDPTGTKENGRLCFIGRLNIIKNLDLLIEALAALPDTRLVLIGQGEEQPRLLELARHCDVAVEFAGQLPHEQLPDALNRTEIFVLPSRFEGHPKALIEAMACGTAVLGADVEGIHDVIQHGQTGWLCPPTVEGIRQALQTLLADAALRRRLGENGRQFVVDHYSLDQVARQELTLYQNLLTDYARSRSDLSLP
jgi:glycosyltransferase involved in cell wall biosynthesis